MINTKRLKEILQKTRQETLETHIKLAQDNLLIISRTEIKLTEQGRKRALETICKLSGEEQTLLRHFYRGEMVY